MVKREFNCTIEGDKLRCTESVSPEDIMVRELIREDLMSKIGSNKKEMTIAGGSILIGWGFLFFAIGLIAYGNIDMAIMLGLFAAVSAVIACLFAIPGLGVVFWVLATFFWGWFPALLIALGLHSDGLTAFLWWFPTIIGLVGGVIILVIMIAFFTSMLRD